MGHLGPSEACPCGSGLEYGDCCWDKEFRWHQAPDGTIYRAVPISDKMLEAIEKAEQQFEHIFRRAPTEADNLFPEVYITSVADDREQLDELLREVDIDPAKRYATWKTGLIPVEGRDDLLSDAEIDAWVAAYEEFNAAVEEGGDEEEPSQLDLLLDALDPEILRFPYVYGLFLHACPPHVSSRPDNEEPYLAGSAFFYATKALKTFEAIQTLTKYNLGEDALALVRVLYESYLHILFAIREPERHGAWTRARIGLHRGTFTYRTSKRGREDRRVFINKRTGEGTEASISTWTMAASSPFSADRDLHDVLYGNLSDFTHPNPRTIGLYLTHEGWDIRGRESVLRADVLGFGIGLLTLDAAMHLGAFPLAASKDISIYLRHARDALVDYLRYTLGTGIHSEDLKPLATRVEAIDQPWPMSFSAD